MTAECPTSFTSESSRANSVPMESDSTMKDGRVRVILRVRGTDEERIPVHWQLDRDSVTIQSGSQHTRYLFSEVYGPTATNESISREICPDLVTRLVGGLTGLLFAYGLSGSGKSHTLMGDLDSNPGLIPRILGQVLSEPGVRDEVFSVHLSLLGMHQRTLIDFLSLDARMALDTVDGRVSGMVATMDDALTLLRNAHDTRVKRQWSRSHLLCFVDLYNRADQKRRSSLCIADLAGCEHARHSSEEMKEASAVSGTLSALRRCLEKVDCDLTRLLREYLSGHSNVTMLATAVPSRSHTLDSAALSRIDDPSKLGRIPWMRFDKKKLYDLAVDCYYEMRALEQRMKEMESDSFREMMAVFRKQSHQQTILERKLGTAQAHLELEQRLGERKEKRLREAHERELQALRERVDCVQAESDDRSKRNVSLVDELQRLSQESDSLKKRMQMELGQRQAMLLSVREQLGQVQTELDELKAAKPKSQADLDELRAHYRRRIEQVRSELSAKQTQLVQKSAELSSLQSEHESQSRELTEQVESYKTRYLSAKENSERALRESELGWQKRMDEMAARLETEKMDFERECKAKTHREIEESEQRRKEEIEKLSQKYEEETAELRVELSTLKESTVAISELSRIESELSDLQSRFEALKQERNDLMAERTDFESLRQSLADEMNAHWQSKVQRSEDERQRLKQRLDEARERQAESDEHRRVMQTEMDAMAAELASLRAANEDPSEPAVDPAGDEDSAGDRNGDDQSERDWPVMMEDRSEVAESSKNRKRRRRDRREVSGDVGPRSKRRRHPLMADSFRIRDPFASSSDSEDDSDAQRLDDESLMAHSSIDEERSEESSRPREKSAAKRSFGTRMRRSTVSMADRSALTSEGSSSSSTSKSGARSRRRIAAVMATVPEHGRLESDSESKGNADTPLAPSQPAIPPTPAQKSKLNRMRVGELRAKLQKRGVDTTGMRKTALVSSLFGRIKSEKDEKDERDAIRVEFEGPTGEYARTESDDGTDSFFKTVRINDSPFSVGQHVFAEGNSQWNDSCWIGTIESLFRRDFDNGRSSEMMKCRWFWKWDDLPPAAQASLPARYAREDWDLFQALNAEDENSVRLILGRARVFFKGQSRPDGKPESDSAHRLSYYVCHWWFDMHRDRLVDRLSEADVS